MGCPDPLATSLGSKRRLTKLKTFLLVCTFAKLFSPYKIPQIPEHFFSLWTGHLKLPIPSTKSGWCWTSHLGTPYHASLPFLPGNGDPGFKLVLRKSSERSEKRLSPSYQILLGAPATLLSLCLPTAPKLS